MSALVALTAVFAPALLWAAYHYHKDRHQPEPLVVLAALYVLGLAMAWVNAYGYEGLRARGVNTIA